MGRAERIAEVEAELGQQRLIVDQALARIRGLEVELQALRAAPRKGGDLRAMGRAEAILTVLRSTSGTMTPKEIESALLAAGRSDEYRSITATLNYLLQQGAVRRPERGRYIAT